MATVASIQLALLYRPMEVRWEPSGAEIYSWHFAHYGPAACRWLRLDRIENGQFYFHPSHPSLFHLWGALWYRVLGFSEVATRLPSVCSLLLSIPLMACWARRLLPNWAALLATTLFSLAPLTLYFGRIHLFQPFTALCILALYLCYWRWREHPNWTRFVVLCALTMLGTQSDWGFYFALPTLFLWAYIAANWREIKIVALLHGIAGACALAFLWYVRQAAGTWGSLEHSARNRARTQLLLQPEFYHKFLLHLNEFWGSTAILLAIPAIVWMVERALRDQGARARYWLVIAALFQPLSYYAAFPNLLYIHPFYLYYLLIPLSVVLAWGAMRLPRPVAAGLAACLLITFSFLFFRYYQNTRDTKSLVVARWLADELQRQPQARVMSVGNWDNLNWFYTRNAQFRSPTPGNAEHVLRRLNTWQPDWLSEPSYSGFEGEYVAAREQLRTLYLERGYRVVHAGVRWIWRCSDPAQDAVVPLAHLPAELGAAAFRWKNGLLERQEAYCFPTSIPEPHLLSRYLGRALLKLHPAPEVVTGVEFHGLPMGPHSTLAAHIGLERAACPKSNGVVFFVFAREPGASWETLYARLMYPVGRTIDRGLVPLHIPLGQYAGRSIDLMLATDANGDADYDWAVWDHPRLVHDPLQMDDGANAADVYPSHRLFRILPAAATDTIVPGVGIGRLPFGAHVAAAAALWGPADPPDPKLPRRVSYSALGFFLEADEKLRLRRIGFNSRFPGATAFPLQFGWLPEQVFAALGQPAAREENAAAVDDRALDDVYRKSGDRATIGYSSRGLIVEFLHDRVLRCFLTAPHTTHTPPPSPPIVPPPSE